MVVEAVHVGEPTLEDPQRITAPEVTKENVARFNAAVNAGKPSSTSVVLTPSSVNEPPRSDRPSQAPLQTGSQEGGTGVGVQVVSAPSSPAAASTEAVLKPVGPDNTVEPAAEKPAESPDQVNDVKPGSAAAAAAAAKKKPKADLSDESSSKKKKKKGLSKLNPF
jgi:outer membrane protein assembly factor BamD